MVKKIIDVPDNTVKMHVTFFNEGYGVQDTMVSAGMLDDAPTVAKSATVVKRVVELPTAEIEDIKEAYKTTKDNGEQTVFGFLLTASDMAIQTDFDLLADWYLGHVELVPDPNVPEQTEEYYVQTNLGVVVNNEYNEGNINLLNYDVPKDKVVMTEKEADEFVKKLAALNARKVKVDE
jgi:hypothetical protein